MNIEMYKDAIQELQMLAHKYGMTDLSFDLVLLAGVYLAVQMARKAIS